jgi:hypothetical protein
LCTSSDVEAGYLYIPYLKILVPLLGGAIQHRASLYADDLVVLVTPSPSDLLCLLEILRLFAQTSGLVTNIDKCVLTPIRCTEEMVAAAREVFPCVLAPFPCKYLGIPLYLHRLSRVDEQPPVDAVATRIPTWKSGLLINAGRTLLTKATLSAIPVHEHRLQPLQVGDRTN